MTITNQHPAAGSLVVGVDQSDNSRHALSVALDTARRLGVGCHAVHAWDYPAIALASPYAASACLADLGPEEHTWLHNLIAGTSTDGVIVSGEVRRGSAGPALVDVAADLDAAFIVVGSVGHGAIVGALLGSVSEYCIHHATCPVVVVPPTGRTAHRRTDVTSTAARR
jgi:nucleotide-binding universal stress UspA family protein